MALIRFQSFDPVGNMLALQQELDRFLRNPAYNLGPSGYGAYPPVNIFEDQEHHEVVVTAELPGVDPAKLNISGQEHTLTISGERQRNEAGNAVGHHRRERATGQFSRSIQLAENLDLSKASAKYNAGVLVIRVPRAESSKPRQIMVQGA